MTKKRPIFEGESIVNKVMDCPLIPWAELKKFEANRLKDSEKRDVKKLANVILEEGFCFPFVVWNPGNNVDPPYVIDGAGRIAALTLLEKAGHAIADLPVVFVAANSREEAQRRVALASSQFGLVTAESFAQFAGQLKGGAEGLLPVVNISSHLFATDYKGPVKGEGVDDEAPKKKGRLTQQTFQPPEFEPEDIIDLGPHQLIVGHDEVELVGKLLKFCRKEWPDMALKRNGDLF